MENTKTRPQISEKQIKDVLVGLEIKIHDRLGEKGYGTFASSHELLGIITEEYHELIRSVESNSLGDTYAELSDIAVGCLFGMACIKAGTMDW